MLLAIDYHYVGDEDRYTQGIYPVSIERFERQMKALRGFFSFVGQQEILDALDGIRPLPEYAAVVTFDDGLKAQYDLALPVLQKYGIPAIFFVCGLPYKEKRALFVHKIHWCRTHLPTKEFLDIVVKEYHNLTGMAFSLDLLGVSDARIQEHYVYDDIDEGRLKFLLNKSTLPITIRDAIINRIFSMLVSNESAFCERTYISKEGLRELSAMGSLGIHGYSHAPFALLGRGALHTEIAETRHIIATITGNTVPGVQAITYPYGTPDDISHRCATVAKENGFRFGFTMERAFNTSLRDPLLFGRLDANDIPEGKAPLFEIRSGSLHVLSGLMATERKIMTCEEVHVASV